MKKKKFYCDKCHRSMTPEEGWIEWFVSTKDNSAIKNSLRLTHLESTSPVGGCYQHEPKGGSASNMTLESMLDPKTGLGILLVAIQKGEVETAPGFELIRRLYIPGYEEARRQRTDLEEEWGWVWEK